MTEPTSRRAVLGSIGASIAAPLAGCLGSDEVEETVDIEEDFGEYEPPNRRIGDDPTSGGAGPPTAETGRPWSHDPETLREEAVSPGVGQDGIPSIDDPAFASADEVSLDDGEPVFGLVRGGEARSYPQYVLVWHEIVNDEVGGDPVAVTYCPLTGTAQGFERGDVEFGVSGHLVNSNLIAYDRRSNSWWSQVAGGGIDGPHAGADLAEFEVTWTTFGRWRRAYPDADVLTENTGYARDYNSDPYGDYDPPSGYYADGDPMFSVLESSDALPAKAVVIGTRTADGALAVAEDHLRDELLVEQSVGGVPYAVVYDRWLDTGYTYRTPEERSIEPVDGRFVVDGEEHLPHDLPLERTLRIDAMWFAWAAFYPDSELVA